MADLYLYNKHYGHPSYSQLQGTAGNKPGDHPLALSRQTESKPGYGDLNEMMDRR